MAGDLGYRPRRDHLHRSHGGRHPLQSRRRGDLRLHRRRGPREERANADAGPLPEDHDAYLANYHTSGQPKAIGRIREVQACRKNGESFPIELSVSEARVADQVIYSAFIRDVSERRAMEDALIEARHRAEQRARLADIGAITARIVHDLGNPLAGLSMQAQLIQRRVARNPDRPTRISRRRRKASSARSSASTA
jgi:signal transduction histidine kinase